MTRAPWYALTLRPSEFFRGRLPGQARLSERIVFMLRVQTLFFSALFVSQFTAPLVNAQTGCTTQSLQLAQQQLGKTLGYITTSQFPLQTVPPPNHGTPAWLRTGPAVFSRAGSG